MAEDKNTPPFFKGDRVVITDDDIDGSFVGEEGTVTDVEWNEGGLMASPRWVTSFQLDIDKKSPANGGEYMKDEDDNTDTFEIERA